MAAAASGAPVGAAAAPAALAALAAMPGAPLAVGLAGAFPLTWAQRRLRRRLGALARGRRAAAGGPDGSRRRWMQRRGRGQG
jgi:hypothetical protein